MSEDKVYHEPVEKQVLEVEDTNTIPEAVNSIQQTDEIETYQGEQEQLHTIENKGKLN